jgi:hypothetical protein
MKKIHLKLELNLDYLILFGGKYCMFNYGYFSFLKKK